MGYTASLTFTDNRKITHVQSCKMETVNKGVEALHKMLLPLMLSWQNYNPYGIQVNGSIVSDDENFWDCYEFKLGM